MKRYSLLALMAALQLGDYLSTRTSLSKGAVEVGMLGSAASNSMALAAVKVACLLAFTFLVFRSKSLRVAALMCAFYASVVVSNLMI